jgi:hypothetical protein
MSAKETIYTKDVTDVLDLFYDRDGQEPDWAAVKTRLFSATDSHYTLIVNLLKAVWVIYEDRATWETVLAKLEQERADEHS